MIRLVDDNTPDCNPSSLVSIVVKLNYATKILEITNVYFYKPISIENKAMQLAFLSHCVCYVSDHFYANLRITINSSFDPMTLILDGSPVELRINSATLQWYHL